MNVKVEELIRESRVEDRVVRAPWSAPLAAALYDACDGDADAGHERHFWGPDWRIHLVIGGAS